MLVVLWPTASSAETLGAITPARMTRYAFRTVGVLGGETQMVDADCIFVNYRRQQSEWPTLRLRDRPVEVFGIERIFTDVNSIEPDQDCGRPACMGHVREWGGGSEDWNPAGGSAGSQNGVRIFPWISLAIVTFMAITATAGSRRVRVRST